LIDLHLLEVMTKSREVWSVEVTNGKFYTFPLTYDIVPTTFSHWQCGRQFVNIQSATFCSFCGVLQLSLITLQLQCCNAGLPLPYYRLHMLRCLSAPAT